MIKFEIILLLLSFFYSGYYIFSKIFTNYENIKSFTTGGKRARVVRAKKKKQINQEARTNARRKEETVYEAKAKKTSLSENDRAALTHIAKRVHLNKVRGYTDKARTLIVEGLAIDKRNKDLNMELADMYETEKEFSKAEYVYRDLLEKSEHDIEILKSLGASLEMQDKNEAAITTYIKAHKNKVSDVDVLEKLSDLTFEVGDYSESMKYTRLYLKQVPRSAEKIAMLGYCLEKDDNIEKAISEYERALQIQPYNTEIQNRIVKLQTLIKE